ncbi:hypothetical protein SHIRM173S_09189 [Streptomyces hirsutus]
MADAQIILAYGRDTGIVAIGHGEEVQGRARGARRSRLPPWRRLGVPPAGRGRGRLACHRGQSGPPRHSARGGSGDQQPAVHRRHRPEISPACCPASGTYASSSTPIPYGNRTWCRGCGTAANSSAPSKPSGSPTPPPSPTHPRRPCVLIERPDHQLGYLVGAFAPEPFEEGYGDPHAPHSIALPPFAGRAARGIADRFLPAYERAVHAGRIATVAEALDRIHAEQDAWAAIIASSRHRNAPPLGEVAETFLNRAWAEFLAIARHAPVLLDRCRPAATNWPGDARVLAELADALTDAEDLDRDASLTRTERDARLRAVLGTWLTHSEPFLRQVRAATPPRQHTVPAAALPHQALPRGPHAPRR